MPKTPERIGNRLRETALLVVLLLALPSAASAQNAATVANERSDASIAVAVKKARTESLQPRSTPPTRIDWKRIENGFAFRNDHREAVDLTILSTSVVSTFACKDIEPILALSTQMTSKYGLRMALTAEWVGEIEQSEPSAEAFLAKNYKRAYELGEYHLNVGKSLAPEFTGWDRAERTVLNQQSYAFVFYSLAWQPIESLEAIHEIDPVRDSREIEGWLYLWKICGYAMGLREDLLPASAVQAKEIVALLRRAQYPSQRKGLSPAVALMLKNELQLIANFGLAPAKDGRSPSEEAARLLAREISTSPGLSRALGLDRDPEKALANLN